MIVTEIRERLKEHGIQPSAQRIAIASFILTTDEHPSADRIWSAVSANFPMISRATVYNTLHLFVEKGLLREVHLIEGCVVYDPMTERHHHFIDEETGRIYDVPWSSVDVRKVDGLRDFDVHEYEVVMRGRARRNRTAPAPQSE
jgi:Fur family transcriptional regulator, iron response regulator